ncbi:GGDEF domain-containing response regulator [Vampirovibrio chlorellavorus]|uniref:GGDEF domain-containing response regulator n=1 Tax=Vampirovibrio chlorellavorus TaxID=758823 RepID=UPI0026EB10B9|nr:diguanylate cyclase [Vampirovibrio chlorellavorus]
MNVFSESHSNPEQLNEPARQGKPLILIIHQDELVVNACRLALEKHGYDIDYAQDGTEGIQKVYRLIPDMILAGSTTPELNGYQICRLVKNDPVMRKIPILLIAEQTLKMDRFWGMKAGADDFLGKDELEARLLQKTQMVLEIYDRMNIQEKTLLKASNTQHPFNIRTRLNQILDTSLVESMLMVEFRSLSDLVHDADLMNYMFFSLLESILEYDAAAIFYNDTDKGPRILTFHLPEGEKQPTEKIEQLMETFFERFKTQGLSPALLELQESQVIGQLDDEAAATHYETVYVKDFYLDATLIGAVAFYAKQKVDYSKIFPVHLVEDEIRLLMKLRHLYSQAQMWAITDSLTGLFNHKHFMSVLQREFKSAKRYEQSMALAMIGLDGFREMNEEWGHACGDQALQHVSRILEESFRGIDFLARYSSKSLAVLLPQTAREQAYVALERFRARVEKSSMIWQDNTMPLKVCAGVVPLSERHTSVSALVRTAENALSAARRRGGNCIEISTD